MLWIRAFFWDITQPGSAGSQGETAHAKNRTHARQGLSCRRGGNILQIWCALHTVAEEGRWVLSHAHVNRDDGHILLKLHHVCCCFRLNERLRESLCVREGGKPYRPVIILYKLAICSTVLLTKQRFEPAWRFNIPQVLLSAVSAGLVDGCVFSDWSWTSSQCLKLGPHFKLVSGRYILIGNNVAQFHFFPTILH